MSLTQKWESLWLISKMLAASIHLKGCVPLPHLEVLLWLFQATDHQCLVLRNIFQEAADFMTTVAPT